MTDDIRLYEEGIEASSIPRVIFGNFMMVTWIGLGAVSCWWWWPRTAAASAESSPAPPAR